MLYEWIEKPSLDYCVLVIPIKKTIMTWESKKDEFRTLFLYLIKEFKIDQIEDRVNLYFKEIYDNKKGISLVVESGKIVISFKGFFFLSTRAYLKIISFIDYLNKNLINFYLNRLDIKRGFVSKKGVEIFFKDLRNDFWITRSGFNSTFQPILITKKLNRSSASYFKAPDFTIVSYDKSNYIENLASKNNKIKKDEKKLNNKIIIDSFNNKYRYFILKNKKILRVEIRLISKKECEYASAIIKMNKSEHSFIAMVLIDFYRQHHITNKDKNKESKIYRSFFI